MLQLQTKKFDIFRISKLLAKYNVKASISNQLITLDGEISDELLGELCGEISIDIIQNFGTETNYTKSDEIVLSSAGIKHSTVESHSDVALEQTILKKYDLLYPTVKRGEVYFCDFGVPYGCEQGYKRPAIVVQNDYANSNSSTTIVLPCTSQQKKCLPVHYSFTFSNENMIDYDTVRAKLN